jgi:quercetin dioxygenase-like cupin family protein
MAKAEHRSFQTPDEVRTFEKGKLELLNMAGGQVGRFTVLPGWRWSTHVKPMAKTDLCVFHHFQYVLAGRMRVKMADGSEFEVEAGQVLDLPPGHDAWVVGNDPFVAVDWTGTSNYAKK